MPKLGSIESCVIDCRSPDLYQQGHFRGAVNIPLAILEQRLFQLPSTFKPLTLHACQQSLDPARAYLTLKNYQLEQVILCDHKQLDRWQSEATLETGDTRYRLWQPANIVKHCLELGLDFEIGLDIGCGAGRDSVFLAQHGIRMTAVDSLPRNITKAKLLADYHQCNIQFVLADINQYQSQQRFDLIVVVRFLSRSLFEKLKQWLNPGGVLIYQTFMQGAEKLGGPKKASFLLQENELADYFSDLIIIENTIEYLPDGRPLSWFIAQKKA